MKFVSSQVRHRKSASVLVMFSPVNLERIMMHLHTENNGRVAILSSKPLAMCSHLYFFSDSR